MASPTARGLASSMRSHGRLDPLKPGVARRPQPPAQLLSPGQQGSATASPRAISDTVGAEPAVRSDISYLHDRAGHGRLPHPREWVDTPVMVSKIPAEHRMYDAAPVPPVPTTAAPSATAVPRSEYADDDRLWYTTSFPKLRPAGRQDVFLLEQWMNEQLGLVAERGGEPITVMKEAQRVYAVTFHELVRQVSVHCIERGKLLSEVWRKYVQLFRRMLDLSQYDRAMLLKNAKRVHEERLISLCESNNAKVASVRAELAAEMQALHTGKRELVQRADELEQQIHVLQQELYEQRQSANDARAELLRVRDMLHDTEHSYTTLVQTIRQRHARKTHNRMLRPPPHLSMEHRRRYLLDMTMRAVNEIATISDDLDDTDYRPPSPLNDDYGFASSSIATATAAAGDADAARSKVYSRQSEVSRGTNNSVASSGHQRGSAPPGIVTQEIATTMTVLEAVQARMATVTGDLLDGWNTSKVAALSDLENVLASMEARLQEYKKNGGRIVDTAVAETDTAELEAAIAPVTVSSETQTRLEDTSDAARTERRENAVRTAVMMMRSNVVKNRGGLFPRGRANSMSKLPDGDDSDGDDSSDGESSDFSSDDEDQQGDDVAAQAGREGADTGAANDDAAGAAADAAATAGNTSGGSGYAAGGAPIGVRKLRNNKEMDALTDRLLNSTRSSDDRAKRLMMRREKLVPGSFQARVHDLTAKPAETVAAMKTRSKNPFRPRPLKALMKTISRIYAEKLLADTVDDREKLSRISLNDFLYEFFLNKYGLRTIAERNVLELIASVYERRDVNTRMRTFAGFLGIGQFRRFDTLDTLNFYLSALSVIKSNPIGLYFDDAQYCFVSMERVLDVCEHMFPGMDDITIQHMVDGISRISVTTKQAACQFVGLDEFLEHLLAKWVELADAWIERLRCIFIAGDTNGDNTLSYDEFKSLMRSLEPERFANDRDLLRLFREALDLCDGDEVSLDAFILTAQNNGLVSWKTPKALEVESMQPAQAVKLLTATMSMTKDRLIDGIEKVDVHSTTRSNAKAQVQDLLLQLDNVSNTDVDAGVAAGLWRQYQSLVVRVAEDVMRVDKLHCTMCSLEKLQVTMNLNMSDIAAAMKVPSPTLSSAIRTSTSAEVMAMRRTAPDHAEYVAGGDAGDARGPRRSASHSTGDAASSQKNNLFQPRSELSTGGAGDMTLGGHRPV